MSLMEGVCDFGRGWGMDAGRVVSFNVFRGSRYTKEEFQSKIARDSIVSIWSFFGVVSTGRLISTCFRLSPEANLASSRPTQMPSKLHNKGDPHTS
jgi:hypothetical protein